VIKKPSGVELNNSYSSGSDILALVTFQPHSCKRSQNMWKQYRRHI